MRLAVFCERMEGWNKRLTRYMRIYQECCMKNLQAEWICDKKGLLEGLANGAYDMIMLPPEALTSSYADFAQIMDAVSKGVGKKKRMYIWNFRGNSIFLKEEEIVYLYSHHRKTYVSDGVREYQIRGGIGREEKRLPQGQFVRIHRNCLVNLNHVKAIEGSYVVLRNGKKLEISIRKKRETEERAASYMSKYAENEKAENLCESTGSLAKERFIC